MTRSHPTRRWALIGLATVGVAGLAVAGGSVAVCAGGGHRRTAQLFELPRLLVGLQDLPDPEAVGQIVARAEGGGRILQRLQARPDLGAACGVDCDASRLDLLRARFREDFTAGRYVEANRWIVSETEALIAGYWVTGPGLPGPAGSAGTIGA